MGSEQRWNSHERREVDVSSTGPADDCLGERHGPYSLQHGRENFPEFIEPYWHRIEVVT